MATLYKMTRESMNLYWNNNSKTMDMYKVYSRYSELKKNLTEHINDSLIGQVQVYRKRRGEWGEWFEHWELKDGKPIIVKEGRM